MSNAYQSVKDVVKSLGIVFGDIGTSPLYTLSAVLFFVPATLENVMGALSLIIWTLVCIVTLQYAWLAMSLAKEGDGEGGTIVLQEILTPMLKSRRLIITVSLLAFVGIAFFIGDGVITPAVSILSAVEGLKLLPGFGQNVTQQTVIVVAIAITIALFAFQKRGTEKVSLAFGPIMLIWFIFLAISGFMSIIKHPGILCAVSPWYGIKFLWNHGIVGFFLLSKVILCATGAEALYVDMGHLGRKPILRAWPFVFGALCLIYLGQGAFFIETANARDIFYNMTLFQFDGFYGACLILSILATIIASQASISGLFSVFYQGMTTHIMPRLHVEYTSRKLMSQIYIPAINTFLLIFVILTIIKFQTSQALTAAYGLAFSGTMTISATLLALVFYYKKCFIKFSVAIALWFLNLAFFVSNICNVSHGSYWSLVAASIPLFLTVIYTLGRRKLNKSLKNLPMPVFIEKFNRLNKTIPHVKGTAVFLARNISPVPAYIAQTMFTNHIIYETNIVMRLLTQKNPFGVSAIFKKDLAPGLRLFEIRMGYMEIMNIEKIINKTNIRPDVVFYGLEDIAAKKFIWKLFSFIKKITPSFVQFYKLPTETLHGVIVRVDMK